MNPLHWYLLNWSHIVLTWGTFTALSMVGAWVWAKRKLIPVLRQHAERQRRIEDLLDTRTKGGIHDVVKAVDALGTATPGGLRDVVDALDRRQAGSS